MRQTFFGAIALVCVSLFPTSRSHAGVVVTEGLTSVLLDVDLLSTAAGLTLSSVSSDVVAGELGAGSVGFEINPRSTTPPTLATTFEYDPVPSLGSFSGTIEHMGSVFFNVDTVEVGDFTIGFDGGRATGANSGFFVESTTGVTAILFDLGAPSLLDPQPTTLTIEGDLLVSPEFAAFLGNAGLTGADVGDARVNAVAVPEPGSIAAMGLGAGAFCIRRRRS